MATARKKKTSDKARSKPGQRAKSPRTTAADFKLPRRAKGKRAQFYDDPAIDELMAIVISITAELSVAFERITTLERILARRGQIELDEVEDYEPDDEESAERAMQREALIARVFQVLEVIGAQADGDR
ncbi:MAG TPA: hypothetical protein P5528_08335 [Steroidobacteraceae bacterium]|nr:hypothetical protein [Steroidobacteraceae bacterium]HRX89442.1 hypothetical protein [Steroidobacteraceae bacterium]